MTKDLVEDEEMITKLDLKKRINNKELLREIEKSRLRMAELAEEEGIDLEDIDNEKFQELTVRSLTDELVNMLILLVEKYATKGNWRNYTFLEDMKSEARLVLIKNALKFSLEKAGEHPNPHSYYTEIVKKSFFGSINKEKREHSGRREMLVEFTGHQLLTHNELAEQELRQKGALPGPVKGKRGRRPSRRKTKQDNMTNAEYREWLEEEIRKFYEKKAKENG